MKLHLIPQSPHQAERIIVSGVGAVLLMAAIDQAQRSSRSDFASELVSFVVFVLIFIGFGLIVYGGIMRIRLSHRPTQYDPLPVAPLPESIIFSDLADSTPQKVTESRLMIGTSLLFTGGILAVIMVISWRGAISSIIPWVIGLTALLCGTGVYAVSTYFSRRRKYIGTDVGLTLFAKRNGFQAAFATSAQDAVINHLKEANYAITVARRRRPQVFFSVQGLLSGRKFLLATFMDNGYVGIVSCSISRPLQTFEFENMKSTILEATPSAMDVISSNKMVTVLFPDGLACDQVSMRHNITLIEYIASVS